MNVFFILPAAEEYRLVKRRAPAGPVSARFCHCLIQSSRWELTSRFRRHKSPVGIRNDFSVRALVWPPPLLPILFLRFLFFFLLLFFLFIPIRLVSVLLFLSFPVFFILTLHFILPWKSISSSFFLFSSIFFLCLFLSLFLLFSAASLSSFFYPVLLLLIHPGPLLSSPFSVFSCFSLSSYYHSYTRTDFLRFKPSSCPLNSILSPVHSSFLLSALDGRQYTLFFPHLSPPAHHFSSSSSCPPFAYSHLFLLFLPFYFSAFFYSPSIYWCLFPPTPASILVFVRVSFYPTVLPFPLPLMCVLSRPHSD